MKTIKRTLVSAVLIVLVSMSGYAETNAKVIGVINEASWCSVCKKNGERAHKALMSNNENGEVKFVTNDLSNDETKTASADVLSELGVKSAMDSNNRTGMVYFFDASSKELLEKISLAKSDEKLLETLASVKEKVSGK